MELLTLKNVSYRYINNNDKLVIDNLNYQFEEGKMYSILGPSGSGKTTLLNLLSGLDSPNEGEIYFNHNNIVDKGYAYHRKHNISIIFQNYNLIDYLNPIENIKLVDKKNDGKILASLGIAKEDQKRNVLQLSGGQQQRVAIARALVTDAPIILADEPTGNLDDKTAQDIINILKKSAHEDNKCVVVVTHSLRLAKQADIILELKNKKLYEKHKKQS